MPENNHALLLSTPGVPTRAKSLKPRLNVSRDSLNSDSSDSDVTNNRRSDSIERHEVSLFMNISTYRVGPSTQGVKY